MIDKKTEILKQDLKMLNVALECYMGKDLEEDSNLSRPVKQALKDFEEAIKELKETQAILNMYEINCPLMEAEIEKSKKENKKLKDENFRLYKELAEVQNVSISSARGNFLYRYRKELENEKTN